MDIEFIDLKKITISDKHLFNVLENVHFNSSVVKHYRRLLFNVRYVNNATFRKETKKRSDFDSNSINWYPGYYEKASTLENKLSNLENCNSLWLLNVYDKLKIKDFIKTNLCKDRFCNNCKKVKQASRMARFIPEIEKYQDRSLYHLTLTVPNVSGYQLRYMVDIMFKAYARLINYFKANKKYYISGFDFSKFNYEGAIRSLEVTYKNGSFHPHIHSLLALNYEAESKTNVNKFSMRFGKLERKFSDTEIFIQKLWRLLITQETLSADYQLQIKAIEADKELSKTQKTKKIDAAKKVFDKEKLKCSISMKAINKLELGYSCTMDIFKEDNYQELFKYMTKAKRDDDSDSSFQDFLHLYFELKNVRQIQGYGCFFRIKDEDIEDEVDTNYDTLVAILESLDSSRVSSESPIDLWQDEEYTLISRKKIFSYLRDIDEQKEEGCRPSLKNVE